MGKKQFKVLREEVKHNGFLHIVKAFVNLFSKRENKTIEVTREMIQKKDAVGVLIKNTDSDEFIFTQQFRYPTVKHDKGYILEIPAGAIDGNEEPLETVKREVMEETGYRITKATYVSTTYVSPGYSSERTMVYYAEVCNADKIETGGGLKEETEEIEVIPVAVEKMDQLLNGKITDAKSLLALQWYQLNVNV